MAEAALGGDAGLAEREERDVFLVAGELVGVRAHDVDQLVNARLEVEPAELLAHEVLRVAVICQQAFDFLIGQRDRIVFHDSAGDVEAVAQPIHRLHRQAFRFVHVADHRGAGEGVHRQLRPIGRGLPDPIHQLLLGADVVGDVLGPLISFGLGGEILILRSEPRDIGFGLQQKTDFVGVGGKHVSLLIAIRTRFAPFVRSGWRIYLKLSWETVGHKIKRWS